MLIDVFDLLGTVAFAISGALTAIEKKMDLFGIFIIACVTAIGGGTLRDILIGAYPVSWLQDNHQVIYIIILTTIVTIYFRNQLSYFRKSIFLFDTIGIGVFTLIGIQKGLSHDLVPLSCVLLGTITACFGGVVRDILCNEIPVLFQKEIYAMACIIGASLFFVLEWMLPLSNIPVIVCVLSIIIIRVLAVKYNWRLPIIKQ